MVRMPSIGDRRSNSGSLAMLRAMSLLIGEQVRRRATARLLLEVPVGDELAGFCHGNTLNQARLAHCPQAQNRSLPKAARSDELDSACVSVIGKSDLPA